ncbi:MAG: type I restriction enzyme HsdR N-terminal domain-containing protein [Phycisphaerae bacterium]|nr:type I restriction enzyme HsdR N-terminal domain-containing protein [Phycisphaerae bacterium]
MAKSNKAPASADALGDGMILDYISGAPKKETPKEVVRQRIARALFHEYAISVDDMEADFPIAIEGSRKRVEIAIFKPGGEHTQGNVCRVAVCRPEPKNGKKGATKMRDHEQAESDLAELKSFMAAAEQCQYGLWTNGLDFFFLQKKATRFDVKFQPLGDWPMGDETPGTREVASDIRMRRADPEMLRIAFRRCHNFIHGNEGMQKDKAFWQFLYLIFSKMHDEQRNGGDENTLPSLVVAVMTSLSTHRSVPVQTQASCRSLPAMIVTLPILGRLAHEYPLYSLRMLTGMNGSLNFPSAASRCALVSSTSVPSGKSGSKR